MNAQLPISTTREYNFFSLLPEQLQLPQRLTELSLRSIKEAKQVRPSLRKREAAQLSQPRYSKSVPSHFDFIKLQPNPTETTVVAMDVASIQLGETRAGVLLAVRGAIVRKQASRIRYLRIGPLPFHITKETNDEISLLLHQNCKSSSCVHAPSTFTIQTRLTSLFERWIQAAVNQMTQDALILWDGSLTAGTPETPIRIMKQVLQEARTRQNAVLAFSKMTRLLVHGCRITDLALKYPPPCALKMKDYPSSAGPMHPMLLMGNTYVVRLTGGTCAFRLDIDKQMESVQAVSAIEKLLGNDSIQQSYPETLRLAHILSTFTATEVLGIQRYVAQEGGIRVLLRPNVRRILFGRFGKGPEG